jgi:hypothetical protein
MKLLALFLTGCLFDGGSTKVVSGPVQNGALCSAAPIGDCPPCSTPDGGQCRDHWYSSALRCTSDAQCPCQNGYCVFNDADGDGLDDDFERELAQLNLPKIYDAPGESCGAPHGVIYRVRRHPQNPKRIAITYVVLYANDCGQLNGHAGDAESFAVTIDPDAQPGAPATVGITTWAHAGTACGSTSSCETAAGTSSCGNGSDEVTVYASRDKHANYLSTDTCSDNCFDECGTGDRLTGPLLDAGEPDHPKVTDLTLQGFVRDGWDKSLQHFNPWSTVEFAGGGRLDRPLTTLLAPPGK